MTRVSLVVVSMGPGRWLRYHHHSTHHHAPPPGVVCLLLSSRRGARRRGPRRASCAPSSRNMCEAAGARGSIGVARGRACRPTVPRRNNHSGIKSTHQNRQSFCCTRRSPPHSRRRPPAAGQVTRSPRCTRGASLRRPALFCLVAPSLCLVAPSFWSQSRPPCIARCPIRFHKLNLHLGSQTDIELAFKGCCSPC